MTIPFINRYWNIIVAGLVIAAFIILSLLVWHFYYYITTVPAGTDHTKEIAELQGEKNALKAENEKLREENKGFRSTLLDNLNKGREGCPDKRP